MANIVITDVKTVLGSNVLMLVDISDNYAYIDGKRGDRQGTNYHVLNTLNATVQRVKVAESIPTVTKDRIEAANAKFEPLLVEFSGFAASLYSTRDSSEIRYSCSAEKARIIERSAVK